MSKKHKLEIPPGLVNLLLLEILFLSIAFCFGIVLWSGIPSITTSPGVHYSWVALVMLTLSGVLLFNLSSFEMKSPALLQHFFLPLGIASVLMLTFSRWQADMHSVGGEVSSIFICSLLGIAIYKLIRKRS